MTIATKKKSTKTKEKTTNEWTKLKKRKSILPEPPQEASSNLQQIEIPYTRTYRPRHITRTGRIIQFATRVTPEFDKTIRALAQQEQIHLAVILEKMLLAYQTSLTKNKKK